MHSMVRIRDIIGVMEEWAPPGIAWEHDNVGLQIGDENAEVTGVIVALEVTPDVINEAIENGANLIITHHPLIFKPLASITNYSSASRLALEIARKGLHVYSAHTNLDFVTGGVNCALAQRLSLRNTRFLHQQGGTLKKISVYVPGEHVERVVHAMTKAGAEIIGTHEAWSVQTRGIGTQRPLQGSSPYSGELGKLERSDEIRVEMVSPSWKTNAVVAAMIDAHPYEEVAYDLYPNDAVDPKYGAGIIGTLENPVGIDDFLLTVRKTLDVPVLRWTHGSRDIISQVAVCGGSGSELLPVAIRHGADAFITADIKYHTFHEAHAVIHLIDAGHYETEKFIVEPIIEHLEQKFGQTACKFFKTSVNTNPIRYSY